jgi:hypothetical protein
VKLILAIALLFSTKAYGVDENYPVATRIKLKDIVAQKTELQMALDSCQVEVQDDEKREVYFFGSGVLLGVVLGLLKR